ncbi:glutamate racemase [Sulfurovum sp. zt1-1]|uniref:Glutamate racemase n=1 Tax=Sulfurovum zhangzhouensis TaxID=3019067 RepID=A0ABT7QWP4_9BACT|nr:glutamate racemase [Sulfurovum zhangzhouensis]MDM5271257.1 glutamate racemase [Sulfurovum zhangzhouensis]
MKVGVFDSGAGGLSVVKSLLKHNLFEEIIYYGDTARVPYGPKDSNTVIRYSLEALEFFNNFDIDLLITACNTVSAHAINEMQAKAAYPVVGVIEPGIKALQNSQSDKDAPILIIGTRATINSNRYQNALETLGYSNLTAMQTGLFVSMVEEGIFEGPLLYETMDHYFKEIETPQVIILGCTHFPLISKAIKNYFHDQPTLIHSGEAIVEYLEETHGIKENVNETKLSIYASDNVEGLRTIANMWLND